MRHFVQEAFLQVTNKSSYSARKMLLDLLGKKSMSLYIAIFMNDLATEI